MIQYWGSPQQFSFNGPAWSISIEVFAYLVFFYYAKLNLIKTVHITIFLLVMLIFLHFHNPYFTQVILCFFFGGLTYKIYENITKNMKAYKAGILTVATCLATLSIATATYSSVFASKLGFIQQLNDDTATNVVLCLVSFPLLILALTLLQYAYTELGKQIRVIGDISYSVYLLHVPVQLSIIAACQVAGIRAPHNTLTLVFYISVVLVLSYVSYRYFELPAQHKIRKYFLEPSNRTT